MLGKGIRPWATVFLSSPLSFSLPLKSERALGRRADDPTRHQHRALRQHDTLSGRHLSRIHQHPVNRTFTIQAYPGEAVWLDGSSAVTDWVKSGNVWVKSGWTAAFIFHAGLQRSWESQVHRPRLSDGLLSRPSVDQKSPSMPATYGTTRDQRQPVVDIRLDGNLFEAQSPGYLMVLGIATQPAIYMTIADFNRATGQGPGDR